MVERIWYHSSKKTLLFCKISRDWKEFLIFKNESNRVYSYFLKNKWQRVFLHSNPVEKSLCVIYTNEGSKKILIKTRGRGTNAIELKLISSSEKSEKEKSNQEDLKNRYRKTIKNHIKIWKFVILLGYPNKCSNIADEILNAAIDADGTFQNRWPLL